MANGWYQLEQGRRGKAPSQTVSPGSRTAYPRPVPRAPVPESGPTEPARCAEPRPAVPTPAVCVPERPEIGPEPVRTPAPEPRMEEDRAPAPTPVPAPAPRREPEWRRAEAALPDPYGDQSLVRHSQTVGPDGPVVLQDQILHETLESFVHEKRVERAVHVKGWGAMGQFVCEHDMSEFTMLPFLQRPGTKVKTACRFSLAVSNKGTPDTSRNVRGFSTKFYTPSGVFDLLCNSLPVFAVRDAIRFPETIRALLPAPTDNLIDPERFWDFAARAPEAANFITRLYSDEGTIKSLRRMRSYGVNTYVWKNARGERRYVKYHWVPALGAEFITAEEAARIACQDPDWAGRDLRDAIRRGDCPGFQLCVQLMDPCDAEKLPFDPLDDTKVWSEADYPLHPVGTLTLDRNPDDYAAQVESLAFSPSNLLEGAELSADKMLQGRSFVYQDAQRYRLGPDFRAIPVNAQRDWRPDCQVSSGLGVHTCGDQVREAIPKEDDFSQAGEYFRGLPPEGQDRLVCSLAESLSAASEEVRGAVLGYLGQADGEYGRRVGERLNG